MREPEHETRVGAEPEAALRLLEGIELLVRRFSLSERADVSCCGLTVAQAATLDVLRAGGPMRQTQLSTRLGIKTSTLTRNLERLEQSGLVERRADPADGRASSLGLTEAGRAAAARVREQKQAFAGSILSRIPAQRRGEVLEGVECLLLAVREATQSCCPGAFDHLMEGFSRATARSGEGNGEGCCE